MIRSNAVPLVSAHDLADAIFAPRSPGAPAADRRFVVLDATAQRPGTRTDVASGFAAAHLPGAQRFDLDAFSDPESTLPHTVPSAARFASLAGALGIDDRTGVVVYERDGLFASPRAWFLLRLFGHEDVRVLDGGFAAWRDCGYPTETGASDAPTPRHFVPRVRTSLLAGLGDVMRLAAGTGGNALLLDARSAGRFDGTAPEPRPGIPSGSIPGSRNLPFTALLAPDGRMKDAASLRTLFAAVGATGDRRVVTSCGTGVTAAALSLGLAVAGLPDAALFDGSWTEWALASGAVAPAVDR